MERFTSIRRLGITAALCGLTLVHPWARPADRPPAQPGSGPGGPTSTADDQVDLSVTVYNSNIALVRDVRDVQLPAGRSDLHFADIAATVSPETVHLRSLTEPARLSILEQNYEYDLLEPEKLLRKYVGRDLTLVRARQDGGTTRTEEVTARLLAFNNGPIWQIGDEIVTGLSADHLRFPELPTNLYSHPTLLWSVVNGGSGQHRLEASYLASSLSWNADYVLAVSRDEKTADLNGWVTLQNGSGTAFRNATLKLVAGDVHRVIRERAARVLEVTSARDEAVPAPMAQEAFAEYHLYSLDRRTTILHNETKQLSLLSGSGAPLSKAYVVEGQPYYYRSAHQGGTPLKDAVKVYYRFRNDKASGLGVPMPAGIIRVYQPDSGGALQFAGEDRIGHTPADEAIDLHVGNAFDIVCERQQTDYVKISGSTFEMAFTVVIRNQKTAPIGVEVNEPLGGSWQMLEASHDWMKADAWTARFTVPVAARGTATLTYRVRTRY